MWENLSLETHFYMRSCISLLAHGSVCCISLLLHDCYYKFCLTEHCILIWNLFPGMLCNPWMAYKMNNTKHKEFKNVICLMTNIWSPSCITGMKNSLKEKGDWMCCKEKIIWTSSQHVRRILLKLSRNRTLLYDVSGSFLLVVCTTLCATEPPSGCQ